MKSLGWIRADEDARARGRRPLSPQRIREIAAGYSAIHDVETVPLAEEVESARAAATLNKPAIRRLKQRVHRVLGGFSDQATRRKVFAAIDAWAKAEKRKTR